MNWIKLENNALNLSFQNIFLLKIIFVFLFSVCYLDPHAAEDNKRLISGSLTYPAHLPELGEHDHNGGVVLPEHPPEVLHRLVQRTLCRDIGVPVPTESTLWTTKTSHWPLIGCKQTTSYWLQEDPRASHWLQADTKGLSLVASRQQRPLIGCE